MAVCGWLTAFGCSDPPARVHGIVTDPRARGREPAVSLDVYALPVPNDIDRQLADLCASDSSLNAIGGLEVPIGPVRVQGDGVELDASVDSARLRSDNTAAAGDGAPWGNRGVYRGFHDRMDSLLQHRAIASARTNDTGFYEMRLAHRDSIELFALMEFDIGGSLFIWRDRILSDGTHDLLKPVRHMTHVYCGEP